MAERAARCRARSEALRVNLTDPQYCLTHFNPGTRDSYEHAVSQWAVRTPLARTDLPSCSPRAATHGGPRAFSRQEACLVLAQCAANPAAPPCGEAPAVESRTRQAGAGSARPDVATT